MLAMLFDWVQEHDQRCYLHALIALLWFCPMSTPIEQAIEAVGGQAVMARLLQVQPAMVSQWATGRRPVAAHHILSIETATGVSRHALRPDVFGDLVETDPDADRIVAVEGC